MNNKFTRSRGLIAAAVICLVFAAVAGAGVAVADSDSDQDDPPGAPAAFYGEALIGDEPAPVGAEIVAYVDGEERGSINIEEAGQYGGPQASDDKLLVYGDAEDDSDETIVFEINEQVAATIPAEVVWESESIMQVDLNAGSPAFFDVTIDDVSDAVTEGDSVTVTATIENTGDFSDSQTVELATDDGAVDERDLSLSGGEAETVEFTYETERGDAPEKSLTVASENDSDSITATVVEPEPAFFAASIDEIADTGATEGDELNVDVTVENTGEREETQAIRFVINGEEIDTEEITLAGGETTALSFVYETQVGDAPKIDVELGSEDTTESAEASIEALEPAFFDVSISDVDDTDVAEGDSVAVTATIENTGELEGTQDLSLIVNGTTEETKESISLEPDATEERTFTFETTVGDAPTIPIEVASDNSSDNAEATIRALDEPNFVVSIDEVGDDVTVGEEITVNGTVENTGEITGTQDITLSANGEQQALEEDVTLDAGATTEFNFTYETVEADVPIVEITVASDDRRDTVGGDVSPLDPPAFVITDITELSDELTQGDQLADELTFAVEIENQGPQAGELDTVQFTIGDESDPIGTFAIEDVSIDAGETTIVTLTDAAIGDVTLPIEAKAGVHAVDVGVSIDGEHVSGESSMTETVDIDYEDIQSGVDAASEGEDVLINEGTYTETVSVTTAGISLVGTDDGAIVNTDSDSPAITLNAPNTAVERLTLDGDHDVAAIEIADAATDAVVRRTFIANYETAVRVYGDNSRISSNLFIADGMDPVVDVQAADVDILRNAIVPEDDKATAGIVLENSPGVLIQDNTIAVAADEEIAAGEPAIFIEDEESLDGFADRNNLDAERLNGSNIFENYFGISEVDIEVNSDVDDPETEFEANRTYSLSAADDGSLELRSPVSDLENQQEPNEPASFTVSGVTISPTDEVVLDEPGVEIEAPIENDGEQSGEQTIELLIDDVVVGSEDIELDGGEEDTVSFTYEATVDDRDAIDIVVRSEDDESDQQSLDVLKPASLVVSDFDRSTSRLVAGEKLTADATIENEGDIEATQDVELRIGPDIDGVEDEGYVVLDTTKETVSGESSKTALFEDVVIESSINDVTLAGDGNVDIGIVTEDGVDSRSIDIREPPEFIVSIDDIDSPVIKGETTSVTTTVENIGGVDGAQDIELRIDGTNEETLSDVSVNTGEVEEVTFTFEAADIGESTLSVHSVDTTDSTEIEVVEPPQFAVEITDSPDTVEAGETITVESTTENSGGTQGAVDLTFEVDGNQESSDSVTVDAGNSENSEFSYETTADNIGDLTLTIAGDEFEDTSTTVDVTEASSEEDSSDDTGSSDPSPPSGSSPAPAPDPEPEPEPEQDETVEDGNETVELIEGDNRTTATFENTSVSQISFETHGDGEVTVTDLDEKPEAATDALGSTVSFTEITVPDTFIDETAIIELTVSTDQIGDIDSNDLTVQRFVGDEWSLLETSVVESNDGSVVLEAETPGFSLFAVTAVSNPTAVATVDQPSIEAGDQVVFDSSESSDMYGDVESVEWSIDGEKYSDEQVSVQLDDTGEYRAELTVTNDAGFESTDTVTVSVTEVTEDETETTDIDTDQTETEAPTEAEPIGDDSVPGFGFISLLLAVVLTTGVALIRHTGRSE